MKMITSIIGYALVIGCSAASLLNPVADFDCPPVPVCALRVCGIDERTITTPGAVDKNGCTVGCPTVECVSAPSPPSPPICCQALTSSCLACSEGVTEDEYCARNPNTFGCSQVEEPRNCCLALTAQCLACANGVTPAEYCATNPRTEGCKPPPVCCQALTSSCLACSEGVTEEEYCARNPNTFGCSQVEEPVEEPRFCCKAFSAECLSCEQNVSEEEFCNNNPATVGCPLLNYGELCQRGGVTTGFGFDRSEFCERGLVCKGKAGVFAIGGEVDKFCLLPCDEIECGAGQYCREQCTLDGSGGNGECVPFRKTGESCGGFTIPCTQGICAPESKCLDLSELLADEQGKCSSCDQEAAYECDRKNGIDFKPFAKPFVFNAVTCECEGPKTCMFQGEEYQIGDQFRDDCNTCTCGENGEAICTEKACGECPHEYEPCHGYYANWYCVFKLQDFGARCVDQRQCQPVDCALDSTCTPFLCTERKLCSNWQHYPVGRCQIVH